MKRDDGGQKSDHLFLGLYGENFDPEVRIETGGV